MMTVLHISISHSDKIDGNRVVHVSAQLLLLEQIQTYYQHLIGSCHLYFHNKSGDVLVIPLWCKICKKFKKIKIHTICKIIHTNMFLMWANRDTSWSIKNGLQHWNLNCRFCTFFYLDIQFSLVKWGWMKDFSAWANAPLHKKILVSQSNLFVSADICTFRFEKFVWRCEWFWSLWAQTLTPRSFAAFIFMKYDTKSPVN